MCLTSFLALIECDGPCLLSGPLLLWVRIWLDWTPSPHLLALVSRFESGWVVGGRGKARAPLGFPLAEMSPWHQLPSCFWPHSRDGPSLCPSVPPSLHPRRGDSHLLSSQSLGCLTFPTAVLFPSKYLIFKITFYIKLSDRNFVSLARPWQMYHLIRASEV